MTPLEIKAPRLNANADDVTITRLVGVREGVRVDKDAVVAEVESDKTTFEIQAPSAGFVLRIHCSEGQSVTAGATILWIADSLSAALPETTIVAAPVGAPHITAKAKALLAEHGIAEAVFEGREGPITAEMAQAAIDQRSQQALPSAGTLEALSPHVKTMARTVAWHAREAVPGYIELPFDHAAWDDFAKRYAEDHSYFSNPLLSLLAFELVRWGRVAPRLNATLQGEHRLLYSQINLGFAMQTKAGLVMAVLRDAQNLNRSEFIERLLLLQKRALSGRLVNEQTSNATIALTSLANARVARHIPVLPPHTSLIVAHSAKPAMGLGVIGATFDHRLLDGHTVAAALTALSTPPSLSMEQAHDAN